MFILKRFSKFLSIILVLTLLLPGLVFAENQSSPNEAILKKVIDEFKPSLENMKVPVEDDLEKFFKDDDEVRIIVELESKPAIVYATDKNINYEKLSTLTIRDVERKIDNEQQRVKNSILANKIDMKFIHSFNTAFNGFSGKVKFEDISLIEKLPLVKRCILLMNMKDQT